MTARRITFFFIFVILLLASPAFSAPLIEYDRGDGSGERHYLPGKLCASTPCVITQSGTIRLSKKIAKKYRVELWALHRGVFRRINLFQESSTFEQKLSERIFNRKPNRKIVDLERLVETGKTDTIYMYGILLQQELDESDLIGLKLISLKNPSRVEEYFFRYHQTGIKWDLDIAFVQPLNFFAPNPGNRIQAAYSTVALSFSGARAMDPDRHYSLFNKAMRAVRFNIFAGLLLRKDVAPFNGDNITKEYIDGFGGLGLTFFNFFAVGYGGNFVRSPHTTFPFVGLEIRHLMEFLQSMQKDTHSRWRQYLKEEMQKKTSLLQRSEFPVSPASPGRARFV